MEEECKSQLQCAEPCMFCHAFLTWKLCLSTSFISETTEQILIKFDTMWEGSKLKIVYQISSWQILVNITSTLHEEQIKLNFYYT